MKTLIPLLTVMAATFWPMGTCRADTANPLLDASIQVSEALTNDNLDAARKAASTLATTAKSVGQDSIADHAAQIETSTTLEEARVHFKAVSEGTVKLATGLDGYIIMTCPMAKADWVQKTTEVQNPYMGQAMPTCGSPKGAKTGMDMPMKGSCCG